MNARRPRSLTSGCCRMLIKQRLSKSIVTCVRTGTPSPHNHEYKCTTEVVAQHLISCYRTTVAFPALPSKQLPSVACAAASTSPVVRTAIGVHGTVGRGPAATIGHRHFPSARISAVPGIGKCSKQLLGGEDHGRT